MKKTNVNIVKSLKAIKNPKYATSKSAGFDFEACIEESITITSGSSALIGTGLFIALEDGFELQVRPRSGLALKNSITVLNSPGTIDADYRGEIKIILINHGKEDFIISNKDRIAQGIITKVYQANWNDVNSLDETERGIGGFGSTGVKE